MKVVLCATKTGGHLLPAVAVARELKLIEPDIGVHLVVSGKGMEQRILKGVNLPIHTLDVNRIKGAGLLGTAKSLIKLPLSGVDAARLLLQLKADVVVGFGGFTTGPLLVAARGLNKRTAILEGNAIPGLTNRILGRIVHEVFVAFEPIARYFPSTKVVVTGMPIRREIASVRKSEFTDRARNILVFGGSQGSAFLNEHVPALLKEVSKKIGSISIIHQTGPKRDESTQARYKELKLEASVVEYLDDMAGMYKWADFVIARSGAGSIAELTAVGLPALLVPFPHAADDHQYHNARLLADAGAALVVREEEFELGKVASDLARLLRSKKQLNEMMSRSKELGRRDAAREVAYRIIGLGGKEVHGGT